MKNKRFALSVLFVFALKALSMAQLPDSIKLHIDSSLATLKNHSLYADKVQWKELTEKVYRKAQGITAKNQTFDALKIAFDALGDKHAAYYQFDDQYRFNNATLTSRYSDSIKAAWSKGPRITNLMMNDIAYVNVPYMGVTKQSDIDKYANWLYDAVSSLSKNTPKAWIIDLRLNGGGNIRPMLAGLAPFFEDGVVSYYIDRDGNATDEAAFKGGNFLIDGIKQADVKTNTTSLKKAKVAVLIGPGTASSGEGVAVVFKQRKNTRLFGTATAGVANATNGFVFNNDNSYFLISTAYIGDKDKKILPEFVAPDEAIKGNDAFSNPAIDFVVQAAIKWLNRQ